MLGRGGGEDAMESAWSADEWRKCRSTLVTPLGASRPTCAQRRGRVAAPSPARASLPFALWLVLLIWPTPQIGFWFATSVPSFTSTTVQSAELWASQTLQRIPDGLAALTSANADHVYWQIGLSSGAEDRHATGMRATIVTTLPQQVSENTTNYFWVGSYLSDGSFVQVGYYVAAHDTSDAGWFYCAFYANGKEGPCEYGQLGTVGVNGANHTYTLESASDPTSSGTIWRAELDGDLLGTFPGRRVRLDRTRRRSTPSLRGSSRIQRQAELVLLTSAACLRCGTAARRCITARRISTPSSTRRMSAHHTASRSTAMAVCCWGVG